jgi:hypothetical protein
VKIEDSPIQFNFYSDYSYLTKEALEWIADFKLGKVLRTVKYVDDIVLLAKEEAALQGVIVKLF